ncbi:MAG: cytochrome c [Phycisphaerales bacterium]
MKTIISVDGARPDVEGAAKYKLRYVHLPIGYDAVPRDRGLEIARAVRDLPGAVYIHCHHGLHRGPAAAAYATVAAEGWTIERAIEFMKAAGTSPNYAGLYDSVSQMKIPTRKDLNAADNKFPATAKLPGFTTAMAEVDRRWDNLKAVREARWLTPDDHPDIDPPHEALQLHELFAELNRTPEVQAKAQDFRAWLIDAERASNDLEQALRTHNPVAAEAAFGHIGESCKSCHGVYRNKPH